MRGILLVCGEAIIVLALGVGVGLGINAARGRNSIHLCRDYRPPPPAPTRPATTSAATQGSVDHPGSGPASRVAHPYAELSFAETVELLQQRDAGYPYVFIDARKDELYEAGHIPGAVQCDFYRIADYIGPVLAAVSGMERIIVYCDGGECEDSLLVCGELVRSDVPVERIALYRGGWKEWREQGMPIATGRE